MTQKLTREKKQQIYELMEKFRDNPSNGNRYYEGILAIIESLNPLEEQKKYTVEEWKEMWRRYTRRPASVVELSTPEGFFEWFDSLSPTPQEECKHEKTKSLNRECYWCLDCNKVVPRKPSPSSLPEPLEPLKARAHGEDYVKLGEEDDAPLSKKAFHKINELVKAVNHLQELSRKA